MPITIQIEEEVIPIQEETNPIQEDKNSVEVEKVPNDGQKVPVEIVQTLIIEEQSVIEEEKTLIEEDKTPIVADNETLIQKKEEIPTTPYAISTTANCPFGYEDISETDCRSESFIESISADDISGYASDSVALRLSVRPINWSPYPHGCIIYNLIFIRGFQSPVGQVKWNMNEDEDIPSTGAIPYQKLCKAIPVEDVKEDAIPIEDVKISIEEEEIPMEEEKASIQEENNAVEIGHNEGQKNPVEVKEDETLIVAETPIAEERIYAISTTGICPVGYESISETECRSKSFIESISAKNILSYAVSPVTFRIKFGSPKWAQHIDTPELAHGCIIERLTGFVTWNQNKAENVDAMPWQMLCKAIGVTTPIEDEEPFVAGENETLEKDKTFVEKTSIEETSIAEKKPFVAEENKSIEEDKTSVDEKSNPTTEESEETSIEEGTKPQKKRINRFRRRNILPRRRNYRKKGSPRKLLDGMSLSDSNVPVSEVLLRDMEHHDSDVTSWITV
jgi:hypothetical protein